MNATIDFAQCQLQFQSLRQFWNQSLSNHYTEQKPAKNVAQKQQGNEGYHSGSAILQHGQ